MLLNLDYRLFWGFISFFSLLIILLCCVYSTVKHFVQNGAHEWCHHEMLSVLTHRQDDYCHLNMASMAFAWTEQSFAYFKTYMLYWVVIPHELLVRFFSFHVLKMQSESFYIVLLVFIYIYFICINCSIAYWGCFLSFFSDCELFVFEILQDENISIPAQEAREILLRNFHVIQKRWGMSQYVLFMRSY